jgi:hypothetical protein
VLSAADVQTCLDQLDAIGQMLAPYVSTLTKEQRRATPKARKDLDRVVPLLARLGQRFGLSSPQLDTAEMERQLAIANLALPLLARVSSLRDMLADTVLASHAAAYETAGTLYGLLTRLGRRNPALVAELAVVRSAFTNKRRATADTSSDASTAADANGATTATTVTTAKPAATEVAATTTA